MSVDRSHSRWSAFLARYVRGGRVDYAAIRHTGLGELHGYLEELETVDNAYYAQMPRADQLAFWLNSYNAYAIKTVVENLPIASIQDIEKPFEREVVGIPAFEPQSLDNIEHDIVRAQFADPRVHFALVCSAESCPTLRSAAYTGAEIDAQLDEQTRQFLNDPTKNRCEGETILLSQIFKWYERDFTESSGSVQKFVSRYLGEKVLKQTVRYLDYDWRLNVTPLERPTNV